MNEHEEKTIAAFILKEKQARYRFLLSSSDPKRRNECVGRLNHCGDLNPQYASWLVGGAGIASILRQAGSPAQVYLISASRDLDGRMMPLEEAIDELQRWPPNGWGTIVSCIPGQLAYYYEEEGISHAILQRKPGT